jgi:coenzyme F420-reducing hydrogenase delta subunit
MENAAKGGFHYGEDAIVIPVTCTGLIKVSFLLKLFAKGMQGVLVLGCPEGDCHYFNGSKRCAEIVEETRKILDLSGIPGQRLGFHLVSESQGREFKRVLSNFAKQFKKVAKRAAKPKKTGRRRKRVASAGHK